MTQSVDSYAVANGSGAVVRAALNADLQALASNNNGTGSPPATFPGMLWNDTTNHLLKLRNEANSGWITLGSNAAGFASLGANTFTGTQTMSGVALNEAVQISLTSATTTDIGVMTSNFANVTGTATITSLGTVVNGARRVLYFSGTPLLTNNANIVLPGGANIQTVSGDVATFIGDSAWRCVDYLRGPASAATTLTGTDPMAFLTAAGFAGNKSLGANGYYKLPGGLIVQWGSVSGITGTSTATFTYPVAFPNNFFHAFLSVDSNSAAPSYESAGLSSLTLRNQSSNTVTIHCLVIGN